MSDLSVPAGDETARPRVSRRARLRALVEAESFQQLIIAIIVANAIVIGLETSQWVTGRVGGLLYALDAIALGVFVVEITLKLFVYRLAFFKTAWNVFDLAIVAIALVPAGQGLTVLRALRILRALRLLSAVPKMRLVVQGLLGAIPAMGSVLALLALVFYVFAVMATKLFGAQFPDWFGSVGVSLFFLFQVMTLESWSSGIARPVMETFPFAWAFFVPFILITTFAVLNLFIAIIVNSMHDAAGTEEAAARPNLDALTQEVRLLRDEVAAMRAGLGDAAAPAASQRDPRSGGERGV